MQVLGFFGWLAICALVSYLTAFQMPDGYGNAIFALQFIGSIVSAGFIGHGAPSWWDPNTPIVVTRGGRNVVSTWSREKGRSYTIMGLVIFAVASIGGWILDVKLGLPVRHATDVRVKFAGWSARPDGGFAQCLATVWTPRAADCTLRYLVTANEKTVTFEMQSVACSSTVVQACAEEHLERGEYEVSEKQLASLRFGGPTMIDQNLSALSGSGPRPPAERE